jgi:hypothetical protein
MTKYRLHLWLISDILVSRIISIQGDIREQGVSI